ncbi:MAG: hypothetical protein ACYCUV_07360, partial [Phycisphaerae bacterium]
YILTTNIHGGYCNAKSHFRGIPSREKSRIGAAMFYLLQKRKSDMVSILNVTHWRSSSQEILFSTYAAAGPNRAGIQRDIDF